jgi:hypothetical protein
VTWQDGRLAAGTLREAPQAANIALEDCIFVSVFHGDDERDREPCGNVPAVVRSLAAGGATVVGLSRAVPRILQRVGVAHVPLTHPAARGAIRARATSQLHVRACLSALRCAAHPPAPPAYACWRLPGRDRGHRRPWCRESETRKRERNTPDE